DTFVQSLIDEGRITEEEAQTHPQRSLLLRAITGQDIDPSLTMREARPGDRFLLCSDGLSGVVSDETLAETLTTYRDPRECADRMIELALRGGGPDNITCIVADVVDIDFGDDAPIVGGSAGDGRDEGPHPDSAAARASATTMTRALPRVEPAAVAAAPRKRPTLRIIAAVGAVVLVLAAAGGLARLWVMQQYFVGLDTDQVTIFQGVRGDVLGLPLHDVVQRTDLTVDDLTESDRSALDNGIVSTNGLEGAQSVVTMLTDRKLKPCPVISATSVAAAPTTAAAAPAPAAGQPNPVPPPTTTRPTTTPLPQATGIPGVTCRAG
ncbi:MAG: serine/threonine-protein phosphatase, partial [Pseudonocardia sp.]|nr:serine/threonine-protein phosphatase [Pseudonocardia sp.]